MPRPHKINHSYLKLAQESESKLSCLDGINKQSKKINKKYIFNNKIEIKNTTNYTFCK